MADPRRLELDDLLVRPGTYFHPQTEVLLVIDDTAVLDAEMFDVDDHEVAEWVIVSDEVPVDEHKRDELIEAFQHQYAEGGVSSDDDVEDVEDELEPDDDPAELE